MKGMSERLFPRNLYYVALFILPQQAFGQEKFTTSFFFEYAFSCFQCCDLGRHSIIPSHASCFMLFLMQAEVAEKREGGESGGGGLLPPDWHLSGPGAHYHFFFRINYHDTVIKLSWHFPKKISGHLLGPGAKYHVFSQINYHDTVIKLSWHFHETIRTPVDRTWCKLICPRILDITGYHDYIVPVRT